MKDLSIVIPARNEMFLARTIQDILEHIEADTEVIAVMDGAWADPPVQDSERVHIIYVGKAIGQRAATNLGVKLSQAKYVMKADAHCAFDQGFDRKMLQGFAQTGDGVVTVPVMRNLHAFDWKCYKCGWKKYQGPTPEKCGQCGRTHRLRRKIMWVGKSNPQSTSFCFDSEPHFRYFEDYKHREPYLTDKKTGFTETMSFQGSCFMSTRENYWRWELCDDKAGSWGNQGMEVACAAWLSGGRCLINHNTWYAHMFRTQGGDFGFPYDNRGREVQRTKNYIRDKFYNKQHPTQIQSVKWLIEKFSPVPGWTKEEINKLI
jgi:hypothetical protein